MATLGCAPSGLTFPVGQRLPQPRELGPQLRHRDEAFLLLVHHPQGLQDLLLWRLLLELLVHDAQQGGKVQHTTAICGRDKTRPEEAEKSHIREGKMKLDLQTEEQ